MSIAVGRYFRINKQFFIFLLVGGFAASVNFFSRMLYGLLMPYAYSIAVAYFTGMVCAYLLCRYFVFKSKQNTPTKEMIWFVIVNIVSFSLTFIVSIVLCNHVLLFITQPFLREEIAHFVGICVPAVSSYYGHKYLSFK